MLLGDEWKAISARITGLREASTLYLLGTSSKARSNETAKHLLTAVTVLFKELESFHDRYVEVLPPPAGKVLHDFLSSSSARNDVPDNVTYWGVQKAVIELCALETEFSYCLSNREVTVRRVVQRAFLHLSRSLVVDHDLSAKWKAALNLGGEVQVEQLGGIHLLAHGIWAFKCGAAGERTDLVLGDILSNDREIAEVATGLVLTEWKVAHRTSEVEAQWNKAKNQAQRYSLGALAGFELRSVRYLVLVTEDHVRVPDDIRDGNVTYRHVNIAVAPSSPSTLGRLIGSP